MKINDLGNFRYSITGLANGSIRPFRPANLASLTVTMSATYEQLIEFHKKRLISESTAQNPEQIIRNHLTALRGFISANGKTTGSPIGEELASTYADALRKYQASLNVSERSASDRRSILNAWKSSFESLGAAPQISVRGRERHGSAIQSHPANPFERSLKSALKSSGLTPRRAAQLAGISMSAIGRWTRGALPNIRSAHTLPKLEAALSLPAGHLSSALTEATMKLAPTHRNEFRERFRQRCKDTYLLKLNELTDEFLSEWQALLDYKTTKSKGPADSKRRLSWTVSVAAIKSDSIPGITTHNDKYIGSARAAWERVRAYLGYLKLPQENQGYGLPPSSAQTLAWFAVPESIDSYLAFLTERSGGLRHTGHAVFCAFVASLTHPENGFLTHTPHFFEKLPPEATQGRSWAELCEASRAMALDWKAEANDIARVPSLPIQFLLDQPEPLTPIFQAMEKLRVRSVRAPAKSMEEALARRDELLLGLLISNPLRRLNIIQLTYRDDNTGDVYRTATGEWRIRLRTKDFKNGRGRNRNARNSRAYDVKVAPWLDTLITDYVTWFRPALTRGKSIDSFLVSAKGNPFTEITSRVLDLTRELIPGSGGFGPHAFRHLVATDWLRRNPNDFLTVAELLNDSLAVVMSTYAHLKRDDALMRHSSQLSGLLPPYLGKLSG